MRLLILPAGERIVAPWKNGGGVTSEIAVHPSGASLTDFDWRLSVAQVERGGPFSSFPGIDRLMLVLDGRLELDIAGSKPTTLDPGSPAIAFPGDAVVAARTPLEPVTDINVMVRRGRYTTVLERRRIGSSAALVAQDVTLILATAPLAVKLGSQYGDLGGGDAARIDGSRGALIRLMSRGSSDIVVVHVNAVR